MNHAPSVKRPKIREIDGGVTAARGFFAAGLAAGIKVSGGRDCGILASRAPCSAAGAFTTNAVRASSVDWCESILPSKNVRAVFANSGNANACTGARGKRDTKKIATMVGSLFGARPGAVCVASTGVIGHFLPMEKIRKHLPALHKAAEESARGGSAFVDAIMTTDTKKKEAAVRVETAAGCYTIGGCAKGSGMISPNMATMLSFVTTDASVDPALLNAIVKSVVDRTYNNLTVDGDTSTNDMVLVLANGLSCVSIAGATEAGVFRGALFTVCDALCRKIAADGEGATKRVEVRVSGGRTVVDANRAAKAVANSCLVKTALFGNDPNWGRILCAVGYSGAAFSSDRLTLSLCGRRVFAKGRPLPFPAKKLSDKMKEKVVVIDVDLGNGKECAVVHTCDLTYDYIKINAEYHT
ncbi:MAG TPA: bifunctional glutamate N-acetyltransferase/amino-acid acetyltransferase ArgJ [Chitinivibrionales bacterium]|nr:bifunctional glutamate N-acetyltransferase/amino-acid acetyltransferase ArgJ [Chitinivibrionales bacterium]